MNLAYYLSTKPATNYLLACLILLCQLTQVSSDRRVTWWDCIKKGFYDQASADFAEVERKLHAHVDGVVQPECHSNDNSRVEGLFDDILTNEEAMMANDVCRELYLDEDLLDNEKRFKRYFFDPLCNDEPQVLFDDKYNAGHLVSVTTREGFYDALGLQESTCPDYDSFQEEMFACANPVNAFAGMKLDDYVHGFCLGYRQQRKCYEVSIKKHCAGAWMVAYDRTRVGSYEDVCASYSTPCLPFSLLSILSASAIALLFTTNQFTE